MKPRLLRRRISEPCHGGHKTLDAHLVHHLNIYPRHSAQSLSWPWDLFAVTKSHWSAFTLRLTPWMAAPSDALPSPTWAAKTSTVSAEMVDRSEGSAKSLRSEEHTSELQSR